MTGMVISSIPIGEYDKRLVILTRERGKIHAFARNARRQNSSLLACSQPFTFGKYTVYEGKNAYNLTGAQVENYFLELREDVELVCYGLYFLELADYFSRENLDGTDLLKLLYQSFRALISRKDELPRDLVRYIFEWKILALEGMMPQPKEGDVSPTVHYAMQYIAAVPVEKLYSFTLTEEAKDELGRLARRYYKTYVDGVFHSLELL